MAAGLGLMYVWEFSGAPLQTPGMPKTMDLNTVVTNQVVDFSAGEASSSAFNANTQYVRVVVDRHANVLFGSSPTAVVDSSPLHFGNTDYYYKVVAGHSVSAIKSTADS